MAKITHISENVNDADLFTVESTLQKAIIDLDDEEKLISRANKVIIITLCDDEGSYEIGFRQCGMSMSECIAAVETIKMLFLQEMELIN